MKYIAKGSYIIDSGWRWEGNPGDEVDPPEELIPRLLEFDVIEERQERKKPEKVEVKIEEEELIEDG